MLDQESALEMHVLITEPRGEQWTHAYTFDADHPILKLWPEKIVGPVLKALDFIEFVNLRVWERGVTAEAAELTVLIVVEDKQKRQWDHVIEDIARLCADGGHYRRSKLSKRQHFRSIRAAYREDKKRGAILTSLEAEKMKLLEKKESVDPVHLPNIPFVLRDGLIYYVDELMNLMPENAFVFRSRWNRRSSSSRMMATAMAASTAFMSVLSRHIICDT